MLYNGNILVAGGKCLAEQCVRVGLDTTAKKYQVKHACFKMMNGLVVGKGMRGIPGRVVIDQSHNSLHNIRVATNHKDLYPGVKNPGVQATKEVIGNILGLDINYWALVDLKGFQALIDAVGGIDLDVARKVPIGGGTDHRSLGAGGGGRTAVR